MANTFSLPISLAFYSTLTLNFPLVLEPSNTIDWLMSLFSSGIAFTYDDTVRTYFTSRAKLVEPVAAGLPSNPLK
jgi:hypothetical protein